MCPREMGIVDHRAGSEARSQGGDANRGFDLVPPDSGGGDVCAHISNIRGHQNGLRIGQRAEFDIGTGQPQAKDVQLID